MAKDAIYHRRTGSKDLIFLLRVSRGATEKQRHAHKLRICAPALLSIYAAQTLGVGERKLSIRTTGNMSES
jgi:hypothetical protein